MGLQNKERLQSVQRALLLLRSFTPENPEWGVTELSRKLGLPKTVVFRLVATMEEAGFVEQDPTTDKYKLGGAVFEMASTYAGRSDLIRIGAAALENLVSKTRHAAQIGILVERTNMCLVSVPSPRLIGVNLRPGDRRPAHATATGKVLLAGRTDAEIRALFPRGSLKAITEHTITTLDGLLSELRNVRRQGYAVNRSESEYGLFAVAAPILDYKGNIVAAISMTAPSQLVLEDQIQELVEMIIVAANDVSNHLGSALAINIPSYRQPYSSSELEYE